MFGSDHAPDFPHHFYWCNTPQPLSLVDDLQGYVVLAWFFRTTDVHCHHVVPVLHDLEQRFAARSFRVVGVFVGAHDAEGDPDHVQEVVRQWGLRHAVVVDEDRELWSGYECKAWPTIALIDATGILRFCGAGEPHADRLAAAIAFLLDDAAAAGDEPYVELERGEGDHLRALDGLWFPEGVAVDPGRGLLWIADTARHRVLAARLDDGAVVHTVGRGEPGAADGSFADACLHGPAGLACHDGDVYVAEPGNHLIRRLDVAAGAVETVLGTGRAAVDTVGGGAGRAQPLNSPWGVAAAEGHLFLAMAGTHQVWRVDAGRSAAPCCGTGARGGADGEAVHASFAQPRGVAARGSRVAIADSGAGALRLLDLAAATVRTLTTDLDFPTACAWHGDDHLLVADTLNSRLVRVAVADGAVEILEVDVHRPAGLAVDGDTLFVADTGNHRILRVDLAARTTTPFELSGLPRAGTAFGTAFARAETVTLKPMSETSLRLPMDLPPDTALLPGTKAELRVENIEGYPLLVDLNLTPDTEGAWFVARGIATGDTGEGVVRLRLSFVTCPEPGHVCHLHERRVELPMILQAGAPDTADVAPAAAEPATPPDEPADVADG